MELKLFQVDAFTDTIFSGNPACVVPLSSWLPDETLLQIAKENAVPETAFFVENNDTIHLRWFTPEIEMDLCGHATLATAHVLHSEFNYSKEKIVFTTLSGELTITKGDGIYILDLPSRKPISADLPYMIERSLNIQPIEILKSRDFLLVYENENQIADIIIDRQIFDQINLDPGGVIVTAKGDNCDFVSRFFTPQASILEDPVTGSAHCTLVPYWSQQLNKNEMKAVQLSKRRGELFCKNRGDRVLLGGKAVTYSTGTIRIN